MDFLQTKLTSSFLSLLSLSTLLYLEFAGADGVPAIYVFGDSTADVGNNNYFPGSTAKANFPHNGVDFPAKRATGRFSNGYNGIDFLAMHIGLRRSPPPFLSIASKIHRRIVGGIKGANFASGGSGILDSTGDTMSFTKQIENFGTIRSNMTNHLSEMQTDQLLSQSIFIISSGGNDIFDFFSQNNAPNVTENEKFISSLASTFKRHVENLYSLGGRKFGIVDVPPIGCCPFPRSLNPTGGCLDVLNELSLQFNKAVTFVMRDLSLTMKGLRYSVGSSNAVVSNIIRNPAALGVKETKTACCGGGKFNGEQSCTPNASFCSERNRYLFWDKLHPTHAASKLAGLAIYGGSLQFASPINFKQLVEIDY